MIDDILHPAVVSAEAFNDLSQRAPLFAEEAAQLSRWGEIRRKEFATVRILARRALKGLGLPPTPILRADHGAPVWPAGVVGSMTHCYGYHAAAVARAEEVRTIGVDAEPALPLPDGVLQLIALSDERSDLQRIGDDDPEVCWDRLLFCAKEAVYKAWFPLTGRWLGFEDVRIEIDQRGRFTATLLVPASGFDGSPVRGFSGRWLVRNGLLLATIADWRW